MSEIVLPQDAKPEVPAVDYPTTCGEEKVMVRSELEGVGTPNKQRFNFTMNQTQVECQTDCIFIHKFNMAESPLVSTNPNCPIIDL